jgi:hypothetical protein
MMNCGFFMRIGDLVRRREPIQTVYRSLHTSDGFGLILSRQMGGLNPRHQCATVFWFDRGRAYAIAESLIKLAK